MSRMNFGDVYDRGLLSQDQQERVAQIVANAIKLLGITQSEDIHLVVGPMIQTESNRDEVYRRLDVSGGLPSGLTLAQAVRTLRLRLDDVILLHNWIADSPEFGWSEAWQGLNTDIHGGDGLDALTNVAAAILLQAIACTLGRLETRKETES